MEPNNTARAEADRWLGTSAKLLNGRDLLGSKTFAIRARDADPSNPIADQILAVVDTLIAAEKRVINATSYDWYSILQLPHLARDLDVIADQYGRLMMLLNPDHNGLPYADFALRLVVDAWSVLSDPAKKWMYDSELSIFLQRSSAPASSSPFQVDSASTFQFFEQTPQPQSQQWQTRSEPQRQNRAEEQQIPPQPQNQQQPNLDAGKNCGNANVNNDDCDDDDGGGGGVDDDDEKIESFWTTCPYCYYTYEYPKTFQDCTLRCQNCRRAFHALQIPNPPQITRRTKETTFCCWGFFPLGFSMAAWKRNTPFGVNGTGLGSSPMPFSPVFGTPGAGVKKNVVRKPIVYLDDDDDEEFDVPYSSDDSDSEYDWNSTRKRKKRKSVKR